MSPAAKRAAPKKPTRSRSREDGCGLRFKGIDGLLHACRWHTKPELTGERIYHVCPCGEPGRVA
jgi:hypothetical protein